MLLEADKNTAVFVKGYPTCKAGQLQSQDSAKAEAICRPALIGKGTTNVEIAFPEQKPIPALQQAAGLQRRHQGGVTTFFIHAYITVPTPAAIVTTVKISKEHKGPYRPALDRLDAEDRRW